MAVENGTAELPPYGSFRTFLNLLDRLNENQIPQKIDRHYWTMYYSGTAGLQLMGALRFMNLLAPTNEPTTRLEELVQPSGRKAALAKTLREAYKAVFDTGVNLERAMPGHVLEAFHTAYKVDGDTRRKAVTFFLHAAKYAELPLSSQIEKQVKVRAAPTRNGRRSTQRRDNSGSAASSEGTAQRAQTQPLRRRKHIAPQSQPVSAPSGSRYILTLPSGHTVTVSVDEDALRLPPSERRAVFQIIEQVEKAERSLRANVREEDDDEEYDDDEYAGEEETTD